MRSIRMLLATGALAVGVGLLAPGLGLAADSAPKKVMHLEGLDKGLDITAKAWRPEFGEVATWSKEKMTSDRLGKKQSFIPRLQESVRQEPF